MARIDSQTSPQKVALSRRTSRLHVGQLLYEAARHGDWDTLELALKGEGGTPHTPTLMSHMLGSL